MVEGRTGFWLLRDLVKRADNRINFQEVRLKTISGLRLALVPIVSLTLTFVGCETRLARYGSRMLDRIV